MIETGTDLPPAALLARMKKYNLGRAARDLEVTVVALESFATGKASLTPDILARLAPELFSKIPSGTPNLTACVPPTRTSPSPSGCR